MQYNKALWFHEGKEHENSHNTACWYSEEILIEMEKI